MGGEPPTAPSDARRDDVRSLARLLLPPSGNDDSWNGSLRPAENRKWVEAVHRRRDRSEGPSLNRSVPEASLPGRSSPRDLGVPGTVSLPLVEAYDKLVVKRSDIVDIDKLLVKRSPGLRRTVTVLTASGGGMLAAGGASEGL